MFLLRMILSENQASILGSSPRTCFSGIMRDPERGRSLFGLSIVRGYFAGADGAEGAGAAGGTASTSLPVKTIGPVATPVGEPPVGSTDTA